MEIGAYRIVSRYAVLVTVSVVPIERSVRDRITLAEIPAENIDDKIEITRTN